MFGGTPDAMTSAPGLWAFDARPGAETWTELALDGVQEVIVEPADRTANRQFDLRRAQAKLITNGGQHLRHAVDRQ